MDKLFHVIEGSAVVLTSKGVFRQTKVYHRNKSIYAAYGGGFIKLLSARLVKDSDGVERWVGGTSKPDINYEDLTAGDGVVLDKCSIPKLIR